MDKNNKKILICIINIVSIITIYFLFVALIKNSNIMDSYIFKEHINNEKIDISGYETEHFPPDFVRLDNNDENLSKFCGEERIEFNEEYEGKPIIVLGSSYAYGHGLKRKDSFPETISQITKRPVYNFSLCGSDLPQNIPLIKEYFWNMSEDKRQKLQDAQDIIYIYMYDHINRYIDVGNLEENHDTFYKISKAEQFFNKLFLVGYINERIRKKRVLNTKNDKYISAFIKNVIMDGYKKTKTFFPNAKFTIIIYDEKIPIDNHENYEIKFDQDVINSPVWKELEEESNGKIRVVHTKDVVGFVFDKDYKLKEDIADWHPNEKVWKLFTPLFVKKYLMD